MSKGESLKDFQYRRMKEERRGHSFAYYSDNLHEELLKKGYEEHKFDKDYERSHRNSTSSEDTAKEVMKSYRENNCYARIVCRTNKLRIREYTVYYRKKSNKN